MTARRSLADRLEAGRRAAFIDLACGEPFDGFYVRCRALTTAEIGSLSEQPGDPIESHISALTLACLGVWEEVDGKGVSPIDGYSGLVDLGTMVAAGPLPTFADPELAVALECDPSAGAAVRALLAHPSDAAIVNYGEALVSFSMRATAKVVRDARPS